MRKDEDFKPTKLEDGSVVYTNLDEACKGLPEFGPLYCYICRGEIADFSMDAPVGFFRFEAEDDAIWHKVFHNKCYDPSTKKVEG